MNFETSPEFKNFLLSVIEKQFPLHFATRDEAFAEVDIDICPQDNNHIIVYRLSRTNEIISVDDLGYKTQKDINKYKKQVGVSMTLRKVYIPVKIS